MRRTLAVAVAAGLLALSPGVAWADAESDCEASTVTAIDDNPDPSTVEGVYVAEGGCTPASDQEDYETYRDNDEDGYTAAGTCCFYHEATGSVSFYVDTLYRYAVTKSDEEDCDDDNEDINPGGYEICEQSGDQIDNDCDGSVNSQRDDGSYAFTYDDIFLGTLQLYPDRDGDTHGDENSDSFLGCDYEDGFSSTSTDCDDTDSGVHPGAYEICNNRDDDCDAITDEAQELDPDNSGCVDLFRDVDQDGYGDEMACLCVLEELPVEEGGYQYVAVGGDCDDSNPKTHPRSCDDGVDNDGDGLTDGDDYDCLNGRDEDGTEVEWKGEWIDGSDNDCDGFIPAIELDCDDDGALAMLPENSSQALTFEDVGLEECEGDFSLTCWDGESIELVCDTYNPDPADPGSGLWLLPYTLDEGLHDGRFQGGRRVYAEDPSCSGNEDCDDTCASRCDDLTESCDGLDNDCSGVISADIEDENGLPISMLEGSGVAGTVSTAEIDLDEDGYLDCDGFLSTSDQVHPTDATCIDTVADEALLSDCNNLCTYSFPEAVERCNGFTDECGGSDEVDDGEGDAHRTCGPWSGEDSSMTQEDVYVLLHIDPTPADDLQPGGDVVPLIRPRTDEGGQVLPCDQNLYDNLVSFLGEGRVDSLMEGTDEEARQVFAEGCLHDFGNHCVVARVTLPEDLDENTYAVLDNAIAQAKVEAECWGDPSLVPELDQRCDSSATQLDTSGSADTSTDSGTSAYASTECRLGRPEQYITRSVWTQERIAESRRVVVEWECQAMFDLPCSKVDLDSTPGNIANRQPNRAITADEIKANLWYWKELARYEIEVVDGSLGWCWGDPTGDASTDNITDEVGGDCDDSESGAHRDNPEGPGDLLGWLDGEPADCSTCLDGIDNNCDGLPDCADPACAPCFVGQGYGCGGNKASPCASVGCAADNGASWTPLRSRGLLMFLSLLAGAAVGRRRAS